MGEVTAAVFATLAVGGPFVLWYLLDSHARTLPLRLLTKVEGETRADADDHLD